MEITEEYKEVIKKDLKELDALITTLEKKMNFIRTKTDEMMEVVK